MGRRGKATEGGASLVEFALIVPVLFALLLGTLTGGLTLSRQNSVKNAVREASRFGAVAPAFDSTSLAGLYAQVVAAASGDLDIGAPDRMICVAVIEGSGPDADKWTYAQYTSSPTPISSAPKVPLSSVPDDCKDGFEAGVGSGTPRIWVRADRTSEINAILFSARPTLEARSLSRYEQ